MDHRHMLFLHFLLVPHSIQFYFILIYNFMTHHYFMYQSLIRSRTSLTVKRTAFTISAIGSIFLNSHYTTTLYIVVIIRCIFSNFVWFICASVTHKESKGISVNVYDKAADTYVKNIFRQNGKKFQVNN